SPTRAGSARRCRPSDAATAASTPPGRRSVLFPNLSSRGFRGGRKPRWEEQMDRRDFLRGAAALAARPAGLGAPASPAPAPGKHHGDDGGHGHGASIPRDKISIQLYTLRDQLAADLDGTLKALAKIGYRTVEHAGFAGKTAAEFKAALRRAGLQ